MDAFCLYWLATEACGTDMSGHFTNAINVLGEDAPADAEQAWKTLASIDFDTVDVITIMYDATDYFMGHNMVNSDNPTDITYFTGNLEAGIKLFQNTYPGIRIIVLGPPYAYAIDEDGNYVSSDIQRYGQDVLSIYAIWEWNSCASRNVSFVDNLYGTITEDNAKHYLTDNFHLNKAGRQKIAERFLYVLNYYGNTD
jgi:lysophospholipase L1-like esterase